MVQDTIDQDPKYVFHHANVQSILIWLFQSQDDHANQKMPKMQTMQQHAQKIRKKKQKQSLNFKLVWKPVP